MTLENSGVSAPRTTTDVVFEALHAQILSLELLPGARISEADIAAKLGVSRQPVRDAFNRLNNLRLVKVRPQRATTVSGFSMPEIENARFVRLAVELEVARQACEVWTAEYSELLRQNLDLQKVAIETSQIETFHRLDYTFHKLMCDLSGRPLAFQTILECKQKVDRLCLLSLTREDETDAILADHEGIADALADRSLEALDVVLRRHLGRLDQVLQDIQSSHAEYFEDRPR